MTQNQDNYSAFQGMNLSNSREENETREQYKQRLRTNKKVMELYNKIGRDACKELFPDGIQAALNASAEEINNENVKAREELAGEKHELEYNEEDAKKFIEEQQKNAEKLGEAK